MSQQILNRTIGGVSDNRAVLSNGQLCRNIGVLTNWTKLRIGIQFSFNGAATVGGTPTLALGVHAGASRGYGDGVDTVHFVGIISNTSNLTFTSSSPNDYYTFGALVPAVKIAATTSVGTNVGLSPRVSAAPTLNRSVLIVEITKGSPNFSINAIGGSTNASAQSDVSDALFLALMQAADVADGSNTGVVTDYNCGFTRTMAVDETTNGFLDSANIFWDKSGADLEISAVRLRKMA